MLPRILLLDGDIRTHYYSEIREKFQAEWYEGFISDIVNNPIDKIDLAIVSDERWLPYVSPIICELVKKNIPTLHIVDGIVEWRNTWENPIYDIEDANSMPLFQPILCHKVACLGRSQARIFESWGNLGKCEIIGSPRFDKLLNCTSRKRQPNQPFRILVMTAITPAFTSQQQEAVEQSLLDLKEWFINKSQILNVPIELVWRLTKGLEQKIGVETKITDLTGKEFAEVIKNVDAVITTPSTAMLEAMLLNLPVALLDYNNCPHYVPAAWTITAPQHLERVIPELVDPLEHRLLYQDTILHESLRYETPAISRLIQLIEKMIEIGRVCKLNNQPLSFPPCLIEDELQGHHLPEKRFDLATLYPNHLTLGNMDRVTLQIELGHLKRLQTDLQNNSHELYKSRVDIGSLNVEVQRLKNKLQRLEKKIAGMERSLFWKLRNKWFAFKRFLGLTTEKQSSSIKP